MGADADKPLHVRVAEKLGCGPEWSGDCDAWICGCGPDRDSGEWPHGYWSVYGTASRRVAHYDTDWAAVGPVIERLGLGLCHTYSADEGLVHASTAITACGEWCALPKPNQARVELGANYGGGRNYIACADGKTGLLALCYLILALPDAALTSRL